eukprot:gene9253-1340_t
MKKQSYRTESLFDSDNDENDSLGKSVRQKTYLSTKSEPKFVPTKTPTQPWYNAPIDYISNLFSRPSKEKEFTEENTIQKIKNIRTEQLQPLKTKQQIEEKNIKEKYDQNRLFYEKLLILKKLKENRMSVSEVDFKFYSDSQIVLELVRIDGMLLKNATEQLKSSKNIAMESVKQNGRSIQFVNSTLLVENPIIFLEAYKTSPEIKNDDFLISYEILHQIALNLQFRGLLNYEDIIIEIFEKGVISKHADAHYQLGIIYFEGSEKDFEKAKTLFEEAIRLKHSKAMKKLKSLNVILNSFNNEEITVLETKTNINEYNILSKIGRGAQGTVFKVKRKKDDSIFAMKSMELDLDDLNSSIKEVIMITKLKHPRICEMIDFFTDINEESEVFIFHIVMPLYNSDLYHFIIKNKNSLSENQLIEYVKQLSEAIQHMHQNGIIHRDLKPENIFISDDQKLIVGDFGLSCQSSMKTLRKTKVGTMNYCAPEIFQGSKYNSKCDIFSLGGILFFLLSGKEKPLYLDSIKENFEWIYKSVWLNSEILIELLMNLLQSDPQKRLNHFEVIQFLEGKRDIKENEIDQNVIDFKPIENIKIDQNEEYDAYDSFDLYDDSKSEYSVDSDDFIQNQDTSEEEQQNSCQDISDDEDEEYDSEDDVFSSKFIPPIPQQISKKKQNRIPKPQQTLSSPSRKNEISITNSKVSALQKIKLDMKIPDRCLEHIKKDYHYFIYATEQMKDDKKLIIQAVNINPLILEYVSDRLKNDNDIYMTAFKKNSMSIKFLPEEYKSNEEIIIEGIKQHVKSLYFVSLKLKNDPNFMLRAFDINQSSIEYISDILKDSKDFFSKVLQKNGKMLKYSSKNLKNQKDLVLLAFENYFNDLSKLHDDVNVLQDVGMNLKNDSDVVLKALKMGNLLKYASKEFQSKMEFVRTSIETNPKNLQFASSEIRNNKNLVLYSFGHYHSKQNNLLEFVDDSLLNDEELLIEAAKAGHSLQFKVPDSLKNNKELMTAFVTSSGKNLEFVSSELKNDQDFVNISIKQKPEYLKYASDEIKKNEEFIFDLLKKDSKYLHYSPLKSDKNFVKKALKLQGAYCFNYISQDLQMDKDIIFDCIKQDGFLLGFMDPEYQNSFEVVKLAVEMNPLSIQYASKELKNNYELGKLVVSSNGECLKFLSYQLRNSRDIVAVAVENSPECWKYASDEIKASVTFGRYKIINKIAEGGEAMVFKVERDGIEYAQKNIIIEDTEDINIVFKEYLMLQKLKHENIYEIYDIFEQENKITEVSFICLVMKLYQGDLMMYLDEKYPKGMPEKEIIPFAIQILKGIIYIHENEIIHSDLKPENIFIEKNENDIILKIGDFAHSLEKNDKNSMLGSLFYVSPEVIEQKSHNFSNDLFSFGGIIYRMMMNKDRWKFEVNFGN